MLGAAACSALLSVPYPEPSSAAPGYAFGPGRGELPWLGGAEQRSTRERERIARNEPRLLTATEHPRRRRARSSGARGSGAGWGELPAGSPLQPKKPVAASAARAWDSSQAEPPHPLSQAFIWHQSPQCRGARERGIRSGPIPSGLVGRVPGSKRCPQQGGGCVGPARPRGAPRWSPRAG